MPSGSLADFILQLTPERSPNATRSARLRYVADLFAPLVVGLTALWVAWLGLGAWRLAGTWSGLRNSRWKTVAALMLGIALALLGVYATLIEPRSIVVNEFTIVSADWHGAPLRVAAIGDTHVGGPHVDSARVARIVQQINGLHPDLVVLLGDYGAGHVPEDQCEPSRRREILAGLAQFAAFDARYGVVAVLGNHDSWYGRKSIEKGMKDAGVTVLWNEHTVVHRGGGNDVVVAGIADEMTGYPDFRRALNAAPVGADTMVLSHSPEPFVDMPGGTALMLAAHTHCGQVTIPLLGRLVLPIEHKEYGCHLVREKGKTLFVTGGIGTTFLPVRFLNPPEIVLVTLRSAAAEHG
jgi:predicted MPP superfamily phosphohydrolase